MNAPADQRGRHRVGPRRRRARLRDEPRARVLLRGPRAAQEHAQHAHDDVRRDGRRRRRLDGRGLLARVRARLAVPRLAQVARPLGGRRRARARLRGDDPGARVLRVPGHVRDDHAGARLGRDRRADELPRLRRLPRRCGASSSTTPSRTGSGATGGFLRGLGRARLRGRHGRPRHGGRRRRSSPRGCSGRARTSSASRSSRTTSRTSSSARASCGSGGSASTRARRSRRTGSRRSRS